MQINGRLLLNADELSGTLKAIAGVAVTWVVLYYLNYSFQFININEYISWLFLPATVRLVSVLLFGWVGGLGLFIGCFITTLPLVETTASMLIIPTISALSPYLSVLLCLHLMGVHRDLNNLSGQQLLIIAFVSALVSALSHSGYFYYIDLPVYFLSMLGGDFLGSLVVLYTVKATLNRFSKAKTAGN